MNIRLIKAVRELNARKLQSVIIVLALALGIIGVGTILDAYLILKREMQKNYAITNPAHFVASVAAVDSLLDKQLQGLSSRYQWEYRGMITGRVRTPEGIWKKLVLEVVPDFATVRINRFFGLTQVHQYSYADRKEPSSGELFIEKAAFKEAGCGVGQPLTVLIPGGKVQELFVSGSFHAPGLPPAWMENWVYGFITTQTARDLSSKPVLNEILFRSRRPVTTSADAQAETEYVRTWLADKGITEMEFRVPVPGSHPHAGQMSSFLYLMQVFGAVALVLALALIANIFTALLSRRKREIGIMKSMGATTSHIVIMTLMPIGIVSGLALCVALPLVRWAARSYAAFAAGILNFTIYDATIPWWGYALEIILGIGLPFLMVLMQAWKGSRLTVQEIITDYGIGSGGKNRLAINLPTMAGFTPTALCLRNAFRTRSRLLLMLLTLSAGGVLCMVGHNLSQSIESTINDLFSRYRFDAIITLASGQKERAAAYVETQSAIAACEVWLTTENHYDNSGIIITALPANARMVDIAVSGGDAVITNTFARMFSVKRGDTLTLTTPAGLIKRRVSAIETMFGLPTVYIAKETLDEKQKKVFNPQFALRYKRAAAPLDGAAASHWAKLHAHISGKRITATGETTVRIENELIARRLAVLECQKMSDQREFMLDHMRLVSSFLIIVSVLSLVIGILTMISSISLAVLERQREIGILRSWGTSSQSIVQLFIRENLIVSAIAGIAALGFAPPLSYGTGVVFGEIFLKTPLLFTVSHAGIGAWFVVSLLLVRTLSRLLAQRASTSDLPALLSYE
ncbi:MAG: ABC transporter permease [Chitinivibrionales bacterium]|nr:ABC transporter permease [Chitinivibrionales bacterium]